MSNIAGGTHTVSTLELSDGGEIPVCVLYPRVRIRISRECITGVSNFIVQVLINI